MRHVSAPSTVPIRPGDCSRLAPEPGVQSDDAAFLLAPVADAVPPAPIRSEDVMLLRDEAANLAWAVDGLVEPTGRDVLDRYEDYQEKQVRGPRGRRPQAGVSALPTRIRGTPLLDPLVPEQARRLHPRRRCGGPRSQGPTCRQDRPAPCSVAWNRSCSTRRRSHARARDVTRAYRYARSSDGSPHTSQIRRHKITGRGEGSTAAHMTGWNFSGGAHHSRRSSSPPALASHLPELLGLQARRWGLIGRLRG